jgi:hypothetical protein
LSCGDTRSEIEEVNNFFTCGGPGRVPLLTFTER